MKKSILTQQFKGLFIASVLSQMCVVANSFIDSVLLSGYCGGADALAAYGLVYPIVCFVSVLFSMIGTGSVSIVAQKLSTLDKDSARDVFNSALSAIFIIGFVIMLACLAFTEGIVAFISSGDLSENVFSLTCLYLRGLCIRFPVFSVCPMLIQFLQLDGGQKRITAFSVCLVVLYALLELSAAIISKGSIFALSLTGSVVFWIGFFILFSHCLQRNVIFRFKPILPRPSLLMPAVRIGFPNLLGDSLFAARTLVFNMIIITNALGYSLAVFSVQNLFSDLSCCILLPLCSTTLVMTGVAYAQSSKEGIREVFRCTMRYMIITLLWAVLLFALAPIFTSFFISEPELVPHSVFALRVLSVYMPFTGLLFIYTYSILGCSHVKLSSILSSLCEIYSVLFALLLVKPFGLNGLLSVAAVVPIVHCLTILIKTQIHCKKLIPTLDDLLMLDESICDEGIFRQSWSIRPSEFAASDYSRKVYDFFMQYGVKKLNCNHLSLITEETLENILLCGFRDKKDHEIRISSVYENDGDCTLCVEDNCRPFNPLEKHALMKELNEDGPKHTGLKIICGITKDIKYVNTMSTNTLMVKIHKDAEAQQPQDC